MKKILIYAGPVLVLLVFLLSGIMRNRETGRAPGKRKPFPRERFSEKSTGKVPGRVPGTKVPVSEESGESLSGFLAGIEADIRPIQPGMAAYRGRVKRVAAFLQNSPGALAEAGELILSEAPHIYTKWILLEAIGIYSPSSEAHALLRRLAGDPSLGMGVLVTLMSVFCLAEEYSADSIDYLVGRSGEPDRLARVAQSAIGRIAGKISDHDPQISSRIVSILLGRLREQVNSGKSHKAASTLEAISNTRDPHVVAGIWPLIEDLHPEIRGAALVTLGALDPLGSEARIRLSLKQDPDPMVRIKAIEALMPVPNGVPSEQVANSDRMSDGTLSDLLAVARADENEQVRLEVMDAFHEIYETPPARVTETLRTLAETDSSSHIREMAAWYLEYGYFSTDQ
jgi:hypothetical protein